MRLFNAIIRLNLGTVGAFDQKDFPLEYYEQDSDLKKGSFLIRATLEEMEEIGKLGIDLNENEIFIYDTRLQLEALRDQRELLQDNRKTLNPIKAFRNYKAARLFHAASRTLYRETKSTSETIQREEGRRVQVVSRTQMRMVDEAPPDAGITGFSIELPDGLNDDAKRKIDDVMKMIAKAASVRGPFDDNSLISQLRDDEHAITLADTASLLSQDTYSAGVNEGNETPIASTDAQRSRPTSPQTINHIHYQIIQNSIVTTNSSNLSGFTSTHGGKHNSGASVTQEFAL